MIANLQEKSLKIPWNFWHVQSRSGSVARQPVVEAEEAESAKLGISLAALIKKDVMAAIGMIS